MTPEELKNAIAFYAITFGLAVVVRLAVPLIGEASLPVTMLTPAIAATLMLAVVAPEGTFRQTLFNLGLTRLGVKGWPLAIAAPALIFAVALGVIALTGTSAIAAPAMTGGTIWGVVDLVIGFMIGIAFSLAEEVGWRGYLLPRLPVSNVWLAMLVVGFLHGLWHLPLLLTTDLYHSSGDPRLVALLFLITLTLAGSFYGYLRYWTGSVWPVAIAHGAVNSAWNVSNGLIVTKSPAAVEYIGGESGFIMIAALLAFTLAIKNHVRRDRMSESDRG